MMGQCGREFTVEQVWVPSHIFFASGMHQIALFNFDAFILC